MKLTDWDIYGMIEQINHKLDVLLKHHEIDLSKEDAQVKQATENILEAEQKLPPQQ